MNNNPFSEIILMMQEHGRKYSPPSVKIARVVHVEESDNELLDIHIEVDDLKVTKKNIYISDFLTKEHRREMRTDIMGNIGSKNVMSGTVDLVNDGGDNASSHMHSMETFTIKHTNHYTRDTLKVDDLVAVMPVYDKQTYIILTRIMRLPDEGGL